MTKPRSVAATANDNSIPGSRIEDGTISSSKLEGTIPGSLLEDGTITEEKLDEGSVTNSSVSDTAGILSQKLSFTRDQANAVPLSVRDKLEERISLEDFGAVGDGMADDTAALSAAFNAATGRTLVCGTPGKTYRITSTLSLVSKYFDGNYCTILKDFDGVGLSVTGGAAFSYLSRFNVTASTTHSAVDYDANSTSHGIRVLNHRVVFYEVGSFGHKGAGFYLSNIAPNMNRCIFEDIRAGGNSLAGCYLTGNWPTSNDMSVWDFSGYFTGNYGYGLYATSTCPIRQVTFWIYAENNFLGASAPNDYAVSFERGLALNIWAYVEQQSGSELELRLGSGTSGCTVQSTRQNRDIDQGNSNLWSAGSTYYSQTNLRDGVPLQLRQPLARVNKSDERVSMSFLGNAVGTGSSVMGHIYGRGNASGSTYIGISSRTDTHVFEAGDDDVRVYEDLILSKSLRLGNVTPPASSTSPGSPGQVAWDSNYLYVCVGTNSWKRVSLSGSPWT